MEPIWLEVVDILPEAKDCSTIILRRADDQPLMYRAGQFLTFLIPIHGRELRRSYSLSSAPGVDDLPSITVKRVINGEVSRFLLDSLVPGERLQSLLPGGRFTLDPSAKRIVCIAAGSGMVPVFSLMKDALREGPSVVLGGFPSVVLVSQQHDEESILFGETLKRWQREMPGRFTWVNLLSARGSRLTNLMLEDLLEGMDIDAGGTVFYVCGPPAFMRMAWFTLRLLGYDAAQIRREHFTVEYVPPAPLITDTSPKKITIGRNGQFTAFTVSWPRTILEAALAHGLSLPYSCRGGRCSTCVARCLSGKVKMSINEVLTDEDLQRGLVLPCVGYAESDVELEY